jgi:hypothetical protein
MPLWIVVQLEPCVSYGKGPGSALVEGIFVCGYLASKGAALIAVGPLKKRVEHKAKAEDAKRQKYGKRHGSLHRTAQVLLLRVKESAKGHWKVLKSSSGIC